MKIEIKKEMETPLLSRKRVTLMAEYEGPTPSRQAFRKEIAQKLSADENLIILKHIYTRFGIPRAKIIANVYANMEDLKKLEEHSLLVKHGLAQKKEKTPAAEAKA